MLHESYINIPFLPATLDSRRFITLNVPISMPDLFLFKICVLINELLFIIVETVIPTSGKTIFLLA